jgi:hypothetical protein
MLKSNKNKKNPANNVQQKIFFHHIPKTAGTTLIALLNQRYDEGKILPKAYFGVPARDVRATHLAEKYNDLSTYPLIHGHFPVPLFNDLATEYFRFTILRDPIQRLLSLYRDWLSKSKESLQDAHSDDHKTVELARSLSMVDFLNQSQHPIPALFDNGQIRLLAGAMDESELSEDHFDKAQDTLDRLSLVGLAELFDSFLTLLCSKLGWERPQAVQSLNISQNKNSFNDFTDSEKQVLEERTRLDRILYQNALNRLDRDLSEHLNYFCTSKKPVSCKGPLNRPRGPEFRLTMDQGFEGSGWHVREGVDGERVWRWTGPDRRSSLRFGVDASEDCTLTLKIISVIYQEIINDLNLFLNNHPVGWRHKGTQNGEQIIHGQIPRDLLEEENLLVIEVPFTASQTEVEPSNEDNRQKGIAVTEIIVAPTENDA